jgi:site-specific DNA-methyltransferase (adenine-specific)
MNKHLSEVTNEDCMEGMARYPDKYFDLAIVDPPYGIGSFWKGGSTSAQKNINKIRKNEKEWNNEIPEEFYWNELKRVSKNQIVWGWNYYTKYLGSSESLIFWDKKMGAPNYSQGEIAWTSFNHKVKYFLLPLAIDNNNRTHPCQKPIALYKWLLQNYAKQGDKILDTHLGSGSSRIAAYEMGFDFTAFELDKEYFDAQEKRYKAHIAQLKMELV